MRQSEAGTKKHPQALILSDMNYIKTGLLMVVMAGLFLAIGYLLGGQTGLIAALIFSFVFNFGTFWFSEKIALSFARAKPMSRQQAPWLFEANERISERAGIPAPRIYISPDSQPNAFACGRGPGNASVCFTAGILESMSQREVMGVLAHEIAHIKNRDTLTMTVVASVASAIMWISHLAFFFGSSDEGPGPIGALLVMILGPFAAIAIQMAVSRTREYAADETAARLLGDSEPLADALTTLGKVVPIAPSRLAQPETAHMYIANPLNGKGLSAMFSTHPPIEDRIRRLRSLRFA